MKVEVPAKNIEVMRFCMPAIRLKGNVKGRVTWHYNSKRTVMFANSTNAYTLNTLIITWFTWQIEWFHLFSQNAPRSSDRDESRKCSRTGLLTHRKLLCHNSWGKMRWSPWILQLSSKLNIVMRTFKVNHTHAKHTVVCKTLQVALLDLHDICIKLGKAGMRLECRFTLPHPSGHSAYISLSNELVQYSSQVTTLAHSKLTSNECRCVSVKIIAQSSAIKHISIIHGRSMSNGRSQLSARMWTKRCKCGGMATKDARTTSKDTRMLLEMDTLNVSVQILLTML